MATLPERSEIRRKAVDSLLPQVDSVTIRAGDNNLGDANKFYGCEYFEGYVFICDDDLIYSPGYVDFMIGQIEKHGRKAVISLHGRIFNKFPITSYTRDFERIFCLRGNDKERQVHIVGTGVLAFHSDAINLSIDYFESKNMADIWFSIACDKQGVKRIVPAFEKGLVKHLNPKNTIASTLVNGHEKQVNACNSITWKSL